MLNFLTRYYKLLAVLIFLLVLISIVPLRNGIRINNSLDIWFVQNDSVYTNYIDFRERYSNDEVIVVYVKNNDVFSRNVIELMWHMCLTIDSLPYVRSVFGITNAPYISSSGIVPTVSPLLQTIPLTSDEINLFKNKVLKSSYYSSIFLNKDKNGFLVYVMLKPPEGQMVDTYTVNKVKQIARQYFKEVHFGGLPILNESLNTSTTTESTKLSVLSMAAVVCLLLIFIRKWNYVLIAVLSVVIPILWVFGAYSAMGGSFNMITVIIPSLLLITGTATSIHIVNICYRYYFINTTTKSEALKEALKYVFWPCFFTATTTMAGFASLSISPIEGIRQTGIITAVGVGLVFICSFVVTSIAFLLFPVPKQTIKASDIQLSSTSDGIATFFETINKAFPKFALVLFPLVIAASVFLLPGIRIETNPLDYLNSNAEAYSDNTIIETEVGPFLPVELLLIKNTIFTASDLHKVEEFQRTISEKGLIEYPFSVIDILGQFNGVLLGQNTTSLPKGLGSTEWLKTQYLKYRNDSFEPYNNPTLSELRISGRTRIASSTEYEQLLDSVTYSFSKTFGAHGDIRLSPRGYLPMYVAMNKHIVNGQLKTFALAFFLILGLIIICFKSFKLALIALVPNVFPLSLVVIAMYLFNIPIDHSTAVITCIVLGVAFDDSIHFIYSHRFERKQGLNSFAATNHSLRKVSSAMVSTSVALFAGFIVISTSNITGLVYFGLLCSIAVIGSLLGNIWYFPLVLNKLK